MKKMQFLRWVMVLGVTVGMGLKSTPVQAQEKGDRHPYNISVMGGYLDVEGDFPTRDAFIGSVKLGYDLNDWWSFEGGIFLAPVMDEQFYMHQKADGTWEKVSRLQEEAGTDSTSGFGVTLDALFHPTPWKRLDPYLAVGLQGIGFLDSMKEHDQFGAGIHAGGGVIYNINDSWGIRADYRAAFVDFSSKGTVNATTEVGVRYVFGANVAPDMLLTGGTKDSDADGLTDVEENKIGTNPYDPDTDHDGLSDYDEVKVYHTDPLNPDTDYDGLKDGAEVFNYMTDPNNRDTDGGGVADGHEVMEDGTDPRAGHGADDLQLFELNIQFDYDKAIIKPMYFKDLDIIEKVLKRDPGATARIEGHADKQQKSAKIYNDQLSERRAKACVKYLADKGATNTMTPVGYGFSRPKAKNDDKLGNPVNRRVEVYIRKSGLPPGPVEPIKAVELPPAKAPATPIK